MILNGTGDNLQAFMSAAAATTNPSFFVTFADINSSTSALTPDSIGGALNGTTDVNLVSGVAGAKRMIKNLSICNVDTATVTVTVQFEDGTDRPIQSAIPIPVGKTLYWSLETGWVIQPAEALGFRGALVTNTVDQAVTTSTQTPVEFDAEEYDTSAFHDNSTNNSRITIPAGVSKVRLTGSIRFDANATGRRDLNIQLNGTDLMSASRTDATATGATDLTTTVDQAVSAGDFFELIVFQSSGGNLNIDSSSVAALFSVEVIDPR